jgi:hypothetical protein
MFRADPPVNRPKQKPSCSIAWRLFVSKPLCSALFEIALVLVRFDHVARIIVNANHSVM